MTAGIVDSDHLTVCLAQTWEQTFLSLLASGGDNEQV